MNVKLTGVVTVVRCDRDPDHPVAILPDATVCDQEGCDGPVVATIQVVDVEDAAGAWSRRLMSWEWKADDSDSIQFEAELSGWSAILSDGGAVELYDSGGRCVELHCPVLWEFVSGESPIRVSEIPHRGVVSVLGAGTDHAGTRVQLVSRSGDLWVHVFGDEGDPAVVVRPTDIISFVSRSLTNVSFEPITLARGAASGDNELYAWFQTVYEAGADRFGPRKSSDAITQLETGSEYPSPWVFSKTDNTVERWVDHDMTETWCEFVDPPQQQRLAALLAWLNGDRS